MVKVGNWGSGVNDLQTEAMVLQHSVVFSTLISEKDSV